MLRMGHTLTSIERMSCVYYKPNSCSLFVWDMKFSRLWDFYCCLLGYDAVQVGWCRGNALDLYSGGAAIDSQPRHRLLWFRKNNLTLTKSKCWYRVHKISTSGRIPRQSNSFHTITNHYLQFLLFRAFPHFLQQNARIALRLGHCRFLPNIFRFIIHQSSYYFTMYSLRQW
jgi:hypothetical protein